MFADAAEPAMRVMEPSDREAVGALYAEVFGEAARERWRRRFAWEFEANPAAAERPGRAWVAEHGGGIVAHLASLPYRLQVGATRCLMHYPCDLMVSPAARGRGLAQRLWQAYLDSTDSLSCVPLYAPATGRLCAKLGYEPVAAVPVRARLYDLTATLRHVVERRARGRSAAVGSRLAGAAGAAANAGLALVNAIRGPRSGGPWTIERTREASPDLDHLWEKLSGEFPVIAVRDRAFVKWRFLDDPLFEHLFLLARNDDGTPAGYVDAIVVARGDLRIGRIMDLFCSPALPALADALLAAALLELERADVSLVTCVGTHRALRRSVARSLYVRRRPELPAMLLWKGSPELKRAVHDADAWHLTLADGDEGFSP